jgi:beta-glucosidase
MMFSTLLRRFRLLAAARTAAAFFVTATSSTFAAPTGPALDQAVEALLSKMTLGEKIGQMSQQHYIPEPTRIPELSAMIRKGGLGSILNTTSLETVTTLQRVAVEETRLKIPLLFGLDVIHGFRTLAPIPLAQSCSWNPELIERAARIAAIEATTGGIRWTFAPMLDLTHDPRWGRIAETLGEDPLLTSTLGAAMIRGFQGKDLADPTSLAACAKHFVGYGAAEGGRDYNTSFIPDPELRNKYLPAFKAATAAGVLTFMSAFNDLNGVPTSGNVFTLRKILRDEWGFGGFVVSDWKAVDELRHHGLAADQRAAAFYGIRAGVDMEMVSTTYRDHGAALLKDNELTPALIDDSVRRILRVKFQLGLFDQPYSDPARAKTELLKDEHLQSARELAAQSMVLLKNDGDLLPLSPQTKTIALIGPLADSGDDMRGCWFCEGRPEEMRTPLASLKEFVSTGTRILHAPGLAKDTSYDTTDFPAAIAAAKQADVVVLCLGEGRDLAGEARSRAFLDLPGAQEKLFDAIAATGKPIVLVLFSGRPLVFEKPTQLARSILYAWHPGSMAGPALWDLVFGRTTPSGKLTVTFPRTIGQIPLYYNHRNTGRPPEPEDRKDPLGAFNMIKDPYTSRYIDAPFTPAYVFGYGLSYTTFTYSDLNVSEPDADGARQVSVTLANTGGRDGVEIAQLYVHDIAASLTRPVRELKGFQRVALKAGERRTLTFALPRQALGFHNAESRFIVEPGKFEVYVGTDSRAPLKAEFVLK